MANWATKNSMKGLANFIADIRRCRGRESELKRVNKEMANIRKQFTENKNVDGYQRKKYVCKILYIYMLGYEVDFGYMEALNLLKSNKFSEKQIGYLAVGILLHEEHELIPLLVQALSDDLAARSEFSQCLALAAIANIGGKQMAEAQLAPAVTKLLLAKTSPNAVKKKAALCLLQLFKKYPDFITADMWADRLLQLLVNAKDLGVVSSLMSLLLGIIQVKPAGFEICVGEVIGILAKIILERDYPRDHEYYNVPNPWLQVKLLRFLRCFPPPSGKESNKKLHDVLHHILASGMQSREKAQLSSNHKNAINCVLFEAIDLIIRLQCDQDLLRQTAQLLGEFIETKDTNIKYLGLEAMAHLVDTADEDTATIIKQHQKTVSKSLGDADISIRRRALDLLYVMCDKSNATRIVGELLDYLAEADYDIREELVLKIAILAEKFAPDYAWYVDTVLRLIALGGDNVPDNIWFRVVQIVTNHEELQEYACVTVLKALKHPSCHETTVKVGSYLLGEFGHLIDDKPGSSPRDQFEALHEKFPRCSLSTRALMLSAYAKFLNLYPDDLSRDIEEIFRSYSTVVDAEVQQRACEYFNMARLGDSELMQKVLDVMPAFPDPNAIEDSSPIDSEDEADHEGANQRGREEEEDEAAAAAAAAAHKKRTLLEQAPSTPFAPTSSPPTSPGVPQASAFSPPTSLGSTTQSQTPSEAGGIFAIADDASSSSPDLIPTKSRAIQQQLMQFFKVLCVNSEGILYEDSNLQIGLKSEYHKGMGRIMLYYGNTTETPITHFTTIIAPVNYMSIQVQEIAPEIGPLKQVQQLINVACTTEFQDALSMQVSYLVGGKSENLMLRLPVVLTKFVGPTAYGAQDFFAEWKKVQGPPFEHQSIFKASREIDLPAITNILSTGFHLAVLANVDPNKNNLVASGTLFTTTKQIPVLLRLETNPEAAMIRLTIRTPNAQVTAAVKNLIQGCLTAN